MAGNEPIKTDSDEEFNDSIEGLEYSSLIAEWSALSWRLGEYSAVNPFTLDERIERDSAIDSIRVRQREIELRQAKLRQDYEKRTSAPLGTLGTRERESLLKLLIGMAVAGYEYDPRSLRSDVAGRIQVDLETSGIKIDEDTVRKYLKEAAELLPPSPTAPSKESRS